MRFGMEPCGAFVMMPHACMGVCAGAGERAGLCIGDRVLAVNGHPALALSREVDSTVCHTQLRTVWHTQLCILLCSQSVWVVQVCLYAKLRRIRVLVHVA
jgi:hypothetical protein